MKICRWWIILFVASVILLSSPAVGAFKYLSVGMDCPNFEVIESNIEELESRKVLLIAFWATWSERSIEQLDDLLAFHESYGDSGLEIVAVNVEGEGIDDETADSIMRFFADRQYPFPLVLDRDLEIFYTFGVIAVPSTAVVDSSNIIRYAPAGYSLTSKDRLFDSLLVLLGLRETEIGEDLLAEGYRPDKRALRYYNLGLRLYQNSSRQMAISNLHRSISLDTLFSSPLSLLGTIWLEDSEYDSAEVYLKNAIVLDSMNVSARSSLAKCFWNAGDTSQAKTTLNTTLAIDSFFSPARLLSARIMIHEHQLTDALELLENCEEFDRMNPQVYYLKGIALSDSGKSNEASEQFIKAYELLVR